MCLSTTQEALNNIFAGKTLDELAYHRRCCGCETLLSTKELEPHHITYSPSYVKYLCHECHAIITYLNRKEALRKHHKLSNEERLAVWEVFMTEPVEECVDFVEWFDNLDF
jgi:hypothetical protein